MGTKYIENKWTIYDDYAELYIDNPTHGKFYLKIDLEDYERCSKYHWNIQHAGGKYSYKYYGYARIDGKQTLLHRYIMNVTDRKQTVDHINKDGIVDETDNRKYNLRVCTVKTNLWNIDKRRNNKSGYKGVIWYPYHNYNKWKVSIKYNYKTINLGYYDDLEDAVKARNEAELKYFGEYARLQEFKG
jgi:hypothetical protein